jgi:hypothetical protein
VSEWTPGLNKVYGLNPLNLLKLNNQKSFRIKAEAFFITTSEYTLPQAV